MTDVYSKIKLEMRDEILDQARFIFEQVENVFDDNLYFLNLIIYYYRMGEARK